MPHGDAHIWTALAYYIIGVAMLALAFKVWWTHPINRVFIFGPYLTTQGIKVVMMSWPLVALFGAFIFSCAVDHHVDWLVSRGAHDLVKWLHFFGVIEAVISWLTALVVIYLGGRAVVRLCQK